MRGSFIKEPKRRRGVYLIPNLLTTGNLFSGLASILFVFKGDFQAAAIAIFVAIIFDTLDGTSARLMNGTSQFGVQYDSLSDLISFGVAPGLLIYVWALNIPELGGLSKMVGPAVMFAFVACGALRLARFNVSTSSGDEKAFTGLPIPGAAGVIAALVIFGEHSETVLGYQLTPFDETSRATIGIVVGLLMAFLMVSTIKYPSIKGLKFQESHHFNYLVYAVLIFIPVIVIHQLMLLVLFGGYALSGIMNQGYQVFVKTFVKRKDPNATSEALKESKD